MQRCSLEPVGDLGDLGRRWTALEHRVPGGFFRSWMFMGCLAEERFARARLLSITQDGDDLALALIGERGGRRWLNQTGDAAHDSVFIEHNGLLAAPEAEATIPAALRLAASGGRLELSGIDARTLRSAGLAGWWRTRTCRIAPAVRLTALDCPYLETLSANARAQIRRSQRLYGPELRLRAAGSLPQALRWFEEMVSLHQASWTARGEAGAFAQPHMKAFHLALISRAFGQGQAHLLRIDAGDRHVGTLYNLVADGHVNCYQSGFAYSGDKREKPGLCCHALAIAHYARQGQHVYDLLAGASRYKLTLASGGEALYWGTLFRRWSVSGMVGVVGFEGKARASSLQERSKRLLSALSRLE